MLSARPRADIFPPSAEYAQPGSGGKIVTTLVATNIPALQSESYFE
jgi:hypothetical protein